MAKARTTHRCEECGGTAPRWQGKCPTCGEWNTLVEEVEAPPPAPGRPVLTLLSTTDPAVPIGEVDALSAVARPTGLGELDRVLGGGLVPGSVTLLGGEPGIGKSTLVMQALTEIAATGRRALLVSGEESAQQVKLRAGRLGPLPDQLFLLATNSLPHAIAQVEAAAPEVVVVDSIQTVCDPEVGSPPGSPGQVRECAVQLVQVAKTTGVAIVVVGHVTKDGALAGPRTLEHLVDTVLGFEGDRHHALRLLRATKHRFGPTGELGLFEMGEQGLEGVPDAGRLFLTDRREHVPGSVVVPTLEGQRPLLVEVQALVDTTHLPSPRRSAIGLDGHRLALLLAVLQRRAGMALHEQDVYASAVGGVRVSEPAADLAILLAVASSVSGVAVPPWVAAIGEVGLAGEVRTVTHLGRRLAELARLGFTAAIVPASAPDPPPGIELVPVSSVAHAITASHLLAGVVAGKEG